MILVYARCDYPVFGDDGTFIHIMSAGKSRLETNEARVLGKGSTCFVFLVLAETNENTYGCAFGLNDSLVKY